MGTTAFLLSSMLLVVGTVSVFNCKPVEFNLMPNGMHLWSKTLLRVGFVLYTYWMLASLVVYLYGRVGKKSVK